MGRLQHIPLTTGHQRPHAAAGAATVGAMRFLIAVGISVICTGCANGHDKLQERVEFWRSTLATEVPVGTSTEKIKEWGVMRHVKFNYLEVQRQLYANVERVPETGIPFPCSEWNIILKISVGRDGHSSKNEVSTVGSCL